MSPDKRVLKLRKERKALDATNRDMERRLDEIKALFEKEQVKSEKERLIWASAAHPGSGDRKKKQAKLDKQSRLILGKGLHNVKVLTGKETTTNSMKSKNNELNQFIESQQNQLAKLKLGSRKKSSDNFTRKPVEPFPIKKAQHKTPTPPPVQPHQPLEQEEYVLISTHDDSEIFEVPLTPEGDVPLKSIRAIMGNKINGIYTLSSGRKRIIVANENQLICRPRGGWNDKVFYPLEPPRGSSRPPSAQKSPIKIENQNSLLIGTYNEEAESAAFKAAVMQFRQGNREMDVQVNEKELSVDQKLAETEKMFSTSKLDQIKAEKEEIMRQLSGSQLMVNTEIETGPTQEEVDLEAERDEMREMLFGISKPVSEDQWEVPSEWANQQPALVSTIKSLPSSMQEKTESLGDMWLPTPSITLAPDSSKALSNQVQVSQTLTDDLTVSQTLDFSDDESSLVQDFDDKIVLSRPGTSSGPRPISRASIMTDADLDKNHQLTRELTRIEAQFMNDHDEY